MPKIKHEGRSAYRIKTNELEGIFAAAWEARNRNLDRFSLLDWLAHGDGVRCHTHATQEEATLAATLIQWLGSPVGFRWLKETLERGGYEVKEVQDA